MTVEQWRVVELAPAYEVSDHGRVRRGDRILAATPGAHGYSMVNLRHDGRRFTRTVHTLVLEAFVGPRPAGHVACHYDGDRVNNRLDNLRWDTQKGNMADAIRHGTTRSVAVCPAGHTRTPDNVYASNGACKTCVKARARARQERNLAAGLTSRGTPRKVAVPRKGRFA